MGSSFCPGANIFSATPTLVLKTCETCGSQIEFFSDDELVSCGSCGASYQNKSLYDRDTLNRLRNSKKLRAKTNPDQDK